MKHSVALQSRKATSLAFFCAVCNVIGIRIALRFGRNTSLLIARAKANLLRQGKNPGGSSISLIRPPLRFGFPASSFLGNGGRRHRLALGIEVVLPLGLRPEGRFACLLCARTVRGFSLDSGVGYVRVSCRGDKVLCVFHRPSGSAIGVGRESCTFCRSP